jgi:dihydrolipoamide dehydrogenase
MRLAVIGAGPGGYVAALKAAQLGAEVTVIEDSEVGGTCLNRGCIPTKTLLASTELYARTKELGNFGIELDGTVSADIVKMMERKNAVIGIQIKGIRGLFKSWGVNLVEGKGMLLSPDRIEVEKKDGTRLLVETEKVIIATGSRPAQIPTFPFDGKIILSSDDALNIMEIPKSMIIVGAGAIGCEFACIFRELGTEVTMVETLPRAISTEDVEISEFFEKALKKKKIRLFTGVSVNKVFGDHEGVHATLSDGSELVAEKMLVSIGRALNSDGIGLEAVGVKKGPKGEILVDDKMQTNIEGIFAVGDVSGGMLLAHVASKEGMVAAENACGKESRIDYSTVPAVMFTSPEIASVGLREFQAVEMGIKIRTGHFQFRALGKAHAMGEISGFLKLIADDTDRIVGAHIIGPHASDLIHEAAVAIKAKLAINAIAETIHAHPTLSEGLMEAAGDVHGRAIHMPKR